MQCLSLTIWLYFILCTVVLAHLQCLFSQRKKHYVLCEWIRNLNKITPKTISLPVIEHPKPIPRFAEDIKGTGAVRKTYQRLGNYGGRWIRWTTWNTQIQPLWLQGVMAWKPSENTYVRLNGIFSVCLRERDREKESYCKCFHHLKVPLSSYQGWDSRYGRFSRYF